MSAQSAELRQLQYCVPEPVGGLHTGMPFGWGTQWLFPPHTAAGLSGLQVPPLEDELEALEELEALVDEAELALEDAEVDEAEVDEALDEAELDEELPLEELDPSGTHCAPVQNWPNGHSMPQSPQWLESVFGSTQIAPHGFMGRSQGAPPVPLELLVEPAPLPP